MKYWEDGDYLMNENFKRIEIKCGSLVECKEMHEMG